MDGFSVTSRSCVQQVTRSLSWHSSRGRSRVTPVACSVGDWLLPSKWAPMSADMFESYRDRREAGQYLGRELQRTLPALLQQHQQRLQEHQQQQQEQQQQDQQQQDQHIPDPVHHDSTSTAAATGSPQLDVKDIVVLGLVRGGMPVADAVARALHCPCDAFVVRKIGAPRQPEFGIGAIAEGGPPWPVTINQSAVEAVGATQQQLQDTIRSETRELKRRVQVYRGGRPHLSVAGKVAVLVDDGLATGITACAACQAIKAAGAAAVVLAVPVGCSRTVAQLQAEGVADVVVCLRSPKRFRAVGAHYLNFNQTTDEEVVAILARHPHPNTDVHTAAEAAGGCSAAPQQQGAAGVQDAAPQQQQQQQQQDETVCQHLHTPLSEQQQAGVNARVETATNHGHTKAEAAAAATGESLTAAAATADHGLVRDAQAPRDQAAKASLEHTSGSQL